MNIFLDKEKLEGESQPIDQLGRTVNTYILGPHNNKQTLHLGIYSRGGSYLNLGKTQYTMKLILQE